MKKFSFYAFVMLCVLLASCQEEIVSPDKVKADLPAVIDLSLALPSSDKVETKGIYDYETEVSELMLIMFEENGRKMVILLDDELQPTTFDASLGGKRGYTTNGPISVDADGNPILSGTYKVYAIANWSGEAFGNLTTENLKAMSETELRSAVASNTGFAYKVSGDERFPMSSYTEKVVINPSDPNGPTAVSVTLRRLIAHIEFVFRNGTEVANPSASVTEENPRFTPHSFSVYNIPRNAYLISEGTEEMDNMLTENDLKVYGKAENIEIIGDGKIEFFMLENVQNYGESTTYVQRDAWRRDGSEDGITAPDDKDFIYAPVNSTYVVVKGEYVGTKYFGEVSYTIHLGNFSSKSLNNGTAQYSRGGYDNFTVNRNEYHTYTVTVNGVNSVMTENETGTDEGGANPGAEGTLTQTSGTQFVLDAHYETVMLSFVLDEKCEEPSMIVSTPYNAMQKYTLFGDAADYAGADYKWVKFMAPPSTTSLPAYPEEADQETKLTDIVGLAEELREAYVNNYTSAPSEDHYMISGGKVYVVAFVDEYFYENRGWPGFVNQDNRVLILNPDKNTSIDGNSTAYPTYIFSISQRSIKTTYAEKYGAENPFGVETWDETKGFEGFGTPSDESGLSDDHGYANTQTLLGISGSSGYALSRMYGYTSAITDNSKESHKFASITGINGYNACITRNRDLDGSGALEADELKWYLPAINQYLTLWMGIDYLQGDTQLYDPAELTTVGSDYWTGYNMYSSSAKNHREYWTFEGASYGEPYAGASVRCARNLVNSSAQESEVSSNDPTNRVITVIGASPSALRTITMTGEYTAGHDERSENNRLPEAFQVAAKVLDSSSMDSDTEDEPTLEDVTVNLADLITNVSVERTGSYWNGYTYTYSLSFSDTDEFTFSIDNQIYTETYEKKLSVNTTTISVTISNAAGQSGVVDVYCRYSSSNEFRAAGTDTEISQLTLSLNDAGNSGTTSTSTTLFSRDLIRTSATGLCADYYSEELSGSDKGQWRVPNQRELMLMAQHGYLSDANMDVGGIQYASRTFFSLWITYKKNVAKYEPFVYNGNITLQATSPANSTEYYTIRCVRDAAHIISGVSADGNAGGTTTEGGELF